MNGSLLERDSEQQRVRTNTVEEVGKACDVWLEQYCNAAITAARKIDPSYAQLWEAISATIRGGGKRLRPYLYMLSYRAFGGADGLEDMVSIAAAHELLHQCLLIHDDVIDRDYRRHNKANVAGRMKFRYQKLSSVETSHYANSAAILAGDLLLSDVYYTISQAVHEQSLTRQLHRNIARAVSEVAAGELMDIDVVIQSLHDTNTEKIGRYKTASYSFVLPLMNGALMAGASEHEYELLERFGTGIGIAYQLQDDLLGLFGDEKITGKSTLSDLREGKHTLVLQRAECHATDDQREVLMKNIGNKNLSHEDANAVRQIVRDTGAYDQVLREIEKYTAEARSALDQFTFQPHVHVSFQNLIDSLVSRSA